MGIFSRNAGSRQWLRVVHNNEVVIEKVAHAILVDHLLEDLFF